jgi:hypothetical protein
MPLGGPDVWIAFEHRGELASPDNRVDLRSVCHMKDIKHSPFNKRKAEFRELGNTHTTLFVYRQ